VGRRPSSDSLREHRFSGVIPYAQLGHLHCPLVSNSTIGIPRCYIRTLRFLWWIGGGAIFLVFSAELLIYAANLRTRHQAEALLQEVRTIRVGESTSADVLRIVQHYPSALPGSASSCASDESHSIRIGDDVINRLGFAVPWLRILGARPSGAVAMFLLKKGQVCYVSYSFGAAVSNLDLDAEVTETVFNCNVNATGYSLEACYSVDEGASRLSRRLTAKISNLASAQQRQHAFGFNLACLTSIRGCQQLCEMNPSVWNDVLAQAKMQGWRLPSEITEGWGLPSEIDDPPVWESSIRISKDSEDYRRECPLLDSFSKSC
jgi:hypothetical protein